MWEWVWGLGGGFGLVRGDFGLEGGGTAELVVMGLGYDFGGLG